MSPSVGVVIPTRGHRPEHLRAATRAALGQVCSGSVEVVVVVDGTDTAGVTDQLADFLARGAGTTSRSVRVVANRRLPGLPGARNTGIEALDTDLVAFCDDDDEWAPGKLAAQMGALAARPGAEFASCAIEIEYGSRSVRRLAGTSSITRAHLLRSRMAMVHSSTFLFRRGAFLVDESAPNGQNEDWDLALRAAERRPIVHVDRPLVRVRWGASQYATRWADRIAGLEWMLARHPDLAVDPRGAARVYGQIAFHNAALGRRREAGRWALRAFTVRRGEPRTPIALAVAAGLVSAHTVLGALHHRGHGI
ncbi:MULTISPECIES: glycosyltransferase family 2 protein [Streptosporangium]|uniref:Glycosyltransferase family 2 protein n=1 Tax=Streptosporangium jomthongense TaxID=1193683 RepID=A0ABV8FAR9_9ACTN